MLGPIDYVVVGFKGNNFDGSILDELGKAVDKGIIRVVDLLFIMKDDTGAISGGEFEDQSDELKEALNNLRMINDLPLFTESDITTVGEMMENDTAAAVLLVEHLWAKGLKEAIMNANGYLIADGRIHPEKVQAALQDLELETAETK